MSNTDTMKDAGIAEYVRDTNAKGPEGRVLRPVLNRLKLVDTGKEGREEREWCERLFQSLSFFQFKFEPLHPEPA